MTAVSVKNTVIKIKSCRDLAVAAIATAGLGNPAVAGLPPNLIRQEYKLGTINMIVLVDGKLSPGAMVNAVITATEVKVRAFGESGIKLSDGKNVTGTTTDAIAVACTGRGEEMAYAGTATTPGYLIGNTVFESILEGCILYCRINNGKIN